MARSHRRIFRRLAHCAIRSPRENQAGDPPLAQPMDRQAPHRRLRYAGVVARAVIRRRSARQARWQSMRRHKAALQYDRSEIIWTNADIARHKRTCTTEIAHAVDLAAPPAYGSAIYCAFRGRTCGSDTITITTGKSKHRREAIIPLYDDLKSVLAGIPKRSTTILTSTRGRPWTTDGFGSSFNKAKIAGGMSDGNLHFHDLRGTAATRFYVAGLSERVIAEIMAWEEGHVARIIRRYVDRNAATQAVIRQLNRQRT